MAKLVEAPLSGVRILDFTTMLSGPLATMILADQGAEVLKVEPVEGDYTRSLGHSQNGLSSMFLNNNRNKKSLHLDLKSTGGQLVLERLLKDTDVVVENFRPGVAARLGIDFDELRSRRPELICISINGFGESGPLSTTPTYDPLVQAMSGLASIQAGADGVRPKLIRTILADKLTALTASQAITAALLKKERSGSGDHVRVAMLDAVLQFLWASDMNAHTFVDQPVSEDGAASFIDLIYEVDGGYITISIMTDAQWASLCRILRRDDLIEDPRFANAAARERNVDERLRLTQGLVQNLKRDYLLERLTKADVPCAPVLTRSQVWKHPQVQERGAVLEFEHFAAGKIRQAAPAARFSDYEPAPEIVKRAACSTTANEILRDQGFTPEQIERASRLGAFGESQNV